MSDHYLVKSAVQLTSHISRSQVYLQWL